MERQLGLLPRRGRAGLLQREDIAPGRRVVFALRLDHRRARLLVPAAELGEVDPARVLHRLHKIVGGHRLAVMTLEVQVHAGAKRPRPEQGVLHAHQFGALLVHRHGVEIADLHVGGRAHRVRHRPRVLWKLRRTQAAHLADALHHARVHVGAVLLVAKHGQPFLQRQLKPVAAGDAVAGPVVKIFVRDHAVDVLVVDVGGGVGPGEHVLGVENVEALVLHRAGVEIAHGYDHVAVEIEFQAEHVLVPFHRAFQAAHGETALVELAGFDIDREPGRAPGAGDEAVLQLLQLRRHHGEEIGWLGKGIHPFRKVPSARLRARRDQVAIRQQHRIALALGVDGIGVARHHVRPVDEPGDAAEALRFALGEKAVARCVQALESGVLLRPDARNRFQREALGHPGNAEALLAEHVFPRRQRPAVERHRHQLDLLAVEQQRRAGVGSLRVSRERQGRAHQRMVFADIDIESNGRDQEGRRGVVLQKNSLGCGFAHGAGYWNNIGGTPVYRKRWRLRQKEL